MTNDLLAQAEVVKEKMKNETGAFFKKMFLFPKLSFSLFFSRLF